MCPTYTKFRVEDVVIANFEGKGQWLRGKISQVKEDGTFDILYDDGRVESNVASNRIKPYLSPTKKRRLRRRNKSKSKQFTESSQPSATVESLTNDLSLLTLEQQTNGVPENWNTPKGRRNRRKKSQNANVPPTAAASESKRKRQIPMKGGESVEKVEKEEDGYEIVGKRGKARKPREEKPKQTWKMKKASDKQQIEDYFQGKSHLEIVQEMCRILLKCTPPPSLSSCKQLLDPIHINIFDYVAKRYELQYSNIDDLKDRCEELRSLSDFTVFGARIGYYPVEQAKEEGLKDLLRSLFYGRRRQH